MKTANCTFLCRLMILLLVVHFRPSLSCGSNIYDKRRSRTPLMLGQTMPDTTENSQQASGPAKGKITRNSPEFKKLRPNYNNEIIFKDEEGTGADRLMSKRCKDKLNTLANKVKEEWPDLKLVVTEGWDEQDEHSDESLHYEGRAVDLRLSDTRKASSKIGLLGRLAAEAGFDWVYYIKADHIHASVREDGYVEKQWDGCFSSNSTVKLEKGAYLQVRDLKIGQRVQVMMHDGKIGFSEVIMFADYKPNIPEVSYILIETETPKKSITLTASHLIFSSNFSGAELTAKQARMVTPGEFVLVSQHDQLVPARVSRVSMIKLTGMVAPVTMEGNIIVDGVLASCYAMINDHEVAHMAFAPLRLAHNYAFKAWNTDLSVIQQGLHWYPKLLIKINGALGVLELS